jgi:hypothetical protein
MAIQDRDLEWETLWDEDSADTTGEATPWADLPMSPSGAAGSDSEPWIDYSGSGSRSDG